MPKKIKHDIRNFVKLTEEQISYVASLDTSEVFDIVSTYNHSMEMLKLTIDDIKRTALTL